MLCRQQTKGGIFDSILLEATYGEARHVLSEEEGMRGLVPKEENISSRDSEKAG